MSIARASAVPALSGIHHIKLPVTDMERSAQWYAAVLGVRRLTELDHRRPDGTLFAVVPHHATSHMNTFRGDAADLMTLPPSPEPPVPCTQI